MTKHTLTWNVEQLDKGKHEALEEWRGVESRGGLCPNGGHCPRVWDCAECRKIFPDMPDSPYCFYDGPCVTYGPALVDSIVDQVLALGPIPEEEPFKPFWAVVLDGGDDCFKRGDIVEVVRENMEPKRDTGSGMHMVDCGDGSYWHFWPEQLCPLTSAPDDKYRKMVEKIEAEFMRLGTCGICVHVVDFIAELEKEGKTHVGKTDRARI